jgi:hypothetical protein
LIEKEVIQGGALNRGLKRIFSLYRPSCHIEAYIRPEKNFGRKTLPVEKSSEFKFGEYGGQSAENQNSANGQ